MTLSPQQQQILEYVTQFQMVSIKELQNHFGSRGAVTNAYKMQAKGYLSIEDGHIMLSGKSTDNLPGYEAEPHWSIEKAVDEEMKAQAKKRHTFGFPGEVATVPLPTALEGSITVSSEDGRFFTISNHTFPAAKSAEDLKSSEDEGWEPRTDRKSWLIPAAIIALALSITLLSLTLIQL